MQQEINLSENPGKYISHLDNTIIRQADECSAEVHHFLKYLEEYGLPVEHFIKISDGKEYYEFIDAEMVHPMKWSDVALYEIGRLTAALHRAGQEYHPLQPDTYRPWYLREIGTGKRIWCHGDLAPWNMFTKDGIPYKLIDWEYAGPLDPVAELARVCWLFAQLHDDDLAVKYDLPSPEKRAEQVRIICDGYGLEKERRRILIEQMVEVIICETAHEAIDPKLTPESEGMLWGFAWRTRSLYWIWRNRGILMNTLV